MNCQHKPKCPSAYSEHPTTAVIVVRHDDDQGWNLLCNGVVTLHGGGYILPNGVTIAPDELTSGRHCAPHSGANAA